MTAKAEPPAAITLAGRVRLGCRLALMLGWLLACVPLFYLWRLAGGTNPWPRRFLGGLGRIAGLEVAVSGTRVQGREFLLANHVSWLDIPAIAGATGAAFVAHDGLAASGPLRALCEMNDTVFVARHDRLGVARQIEQLRRALADCGALVLFPEGTTSDGAGLLPFKSSLLSAICPVPERVSVQPVLLDYGVDAPAMAWVGDEPGLTNALRILAQRSRVRLTICFLPPLSGAELADRKTIAAAAGRAIAAALAARRARTTGA